MVKDYLVQLNDFARYYFNFTFKGHVKVETIYESRSTTYKVKVTVLYNDLKIESVSKSLEYCTRTKDVINEFDLMAYGIKEKYKENILF